MKKTIIAVGCVLAALILLLSVYFIFIKDKAEQADNTEHVITPTQAPTQTPTVAPSPSEAPGDTVDTKSLYPAYRMVNGEQKYGYIDSSGAFVIEPSYDYAEPFSEGFAIVQVGNDYRVIDTTGAVLFENNGTINSFHNGMAAFLNTKEDIWLYGYIDQTGKIIIEPSFIHADRFNEEGQAYVSLPNGGPYQLIDQTGKVLESFELNLGNSYAYDFKDGYLLFNDSETMKNGVKRVDGTSVLEPKYSEIIYLGHDLFAVKNPELDAYEAMFDPYALYNDSGEQLTDYTLYDVQPFIGEYACAANATDVFFIDTKGQEVTSLPSFEGTGKLTLMDNIVKADIDGDLAYYRLDNTVLWKEDSTTQLANGIKVKEHKFKPLRTVLVRYPEVEGLADPVIQKNINEQLETLFTESRANITVEEGLSVDDSFWASLNKNLLTISMSGYDYYKGAAHGMPLREYYYIDITTGEFYDFEDLFIKGSDYKKMIDDFIRAKMEEANPEESMYFSDYFTGITDAQHFYLNEKGIVIYFYPYEIAAYAAGFPEFEITFEELREFIDTKGDFWKSFQE